jgi:hypothetical protein
MNKEGGQYYLSNCKSNCRKTDDKINRFNLLCEYFECEESKISKQIKTYNKYELDCIDYYVLKNPRVEYKECVRCNRSLPKSHKFFTSDGRVRGGLTGVCKDCVGSIFNHKNEYIESIYRNFGNDGYILYKNDTISFYNTYCHNKDFKFKCNNENESLKIIKWYYDNGLLKVKDLSKEYINKFFNFNRTSYHNNAINEYCSNNECKVRPYKYPTYTLGRVDYKQANLILDNYIEDNNIIINNILEYNDYQGLLRKSKLSYFLEGRGNKSYSMLEFIVQYFGYEYAGYKFKACSANYYKKKENRDFDLKWFIEKDLKVETNKIPLYITKYALHQKASPLYTALGKGYCGESLFDWVNECYPDVFNINDFEINPYRAEFDSLEEAQVDEYLRKEISKSVLYNGRTNRDVIEIEGMIPDWIIHTNKGCYLVEYFGLYSKNDISSSHRLIRYHEKMKIKMEKYKELEKVGYKTLFIYPDDIRNGFDGLLEKLQQIKN